MKIMQIIREEIVPLSRKQNIVLATIIACIFQFTLFFAPALANQAVQEAQAAGLDQEMMVSNDSMTKDTHMDLEAAKLASTNAPVALASSSPVIAPVADIELISETSAATGTTAVKVDKVLKESVHTMTAYNSEAGQTDNSPCITANGFNVCEHGIEDTIAANFLPMGTKVKIPELYGDRIFIVRDRMNQKHPNRVDVWMKNRSDALKFGVKVAKIQIIE
ncbi:MAG: hypothetical protein WC467_04595 [Patescibacteria group bacterium]